MKFSETELRKLLRGKLKLATTELCYQLTMLGLEVEECEAIAPQFSGVTVGTILQAVQHPNADRLRLCQVSLGSGPVLNIVCGAPNARAGIKVAVASVGACLPGDFSIKESKIRGELSQGMLCSETELGLPENSAGIIELPADAPLGMDLRDYFNLDDHLITINVTPNRGDCLGLYGIARELAILNRLPLPALKTPLLKTKATSIPVQVDEKVACPRYLLAVLEGIDNCVATPKEITQRLARSGIRSISPVVDILNDTMILLGQPMHAFDAAAVKGGIRVAFATTGEKIALLNDETRSLEADTLTIRDAQGAIAIAGIMGSQPSSVQQNTTKILIEAAFFEPLVIAGRARSYGLHTDSSHRFERGVDPNLPATALSFALQKLKALVGGKLTGLVMIEDKACLPQLHTILLRSSKIKKLLGMSIKPAFAKSRLKALGCEILKEERQALLVKVPSFRFDLRIEEDLIEELMRLQGYDNLPLAYPQFDLVRQFAREALTPMTRLKDLLVSNGLQEVVSYSFIDEDLQRVFFDEIQYVLANPITKDLTSMRKSLLPSLLSILQYNFNRQQTEVAIFELGERFVGIPPLQVETLAGLLQGGQTDFYSLKGLIQKMLSFARLHLEFKTEELPHYLHPGQAQTLWLTGKCVGYFGALHPKLLQHFDLKTAPLVFELTSSIFAQGSARQAQPISKFPMIERDLAFLVSRNLPAADLVQAAKSVKSPIVQDVVVFDVYAGDRLPAEQKSIAIKIKLQALERTLVDEEVDKLIATMMRKVMVACKATLRD